MSTPARPGWYDDPQDPSQLRYYDGVVWTTHTTPRSTRPTTPVGGTPPQLPGAYGQAGGTPTTVGWKAPQPNAPQRPYEQFPGTPQPGGWNAPAYGGLSARPSTPDGQLLAGYGQRVVAFLLDWVIQAVLGAVLGLAFLRRALSGYFDEFQRMTTDAQSGVQPDFTRLVNSVDRGQLLLFSLVGIGVFVLYQVFFLARFGQTPGKMALGISVRLRSRPGVPPVVTVLRRVLLPVALFLLQLVPLIGVLGVLGRMLDLLWPAWDRNRQALHDHVAATNVVVGRPQRP